MQRLSFYSIYWLFLRQLPYYEGKEIDRERGRESYGDYLFTKVEEEEGVEEEQQLQFKQNTHVTQKRRKKKR